MGRRTCTTLKSTDSVSQLSYISQLDLACKLRQGPFMRVSSWEEALPGPPAPLVQQLCRARRQHRLEVIQGHIQKQIVWIQAWRKDARGLGRGMAGM